MSPPAGSHQSPSFPVWDQSLPSLDRNGFNVILGARFINSDVLLVGSPFDNNWLSMIDGNNAPLDRNCQPGAVALDKCLGSPLFTGEIGIAIRLMIGGSQVHDCGIAVQVHHILSWIKRAVVLGRNLFVVRHYLSFGLNSPIVAADDAVFGDVAGPRRHISPGSGVHPRFLDIDHFLFRRRELLSRPSVS